MLQRVKPPGQSRLTEAAAGPEFASPIDVAKQWKELTGKIERAAHEAEHSGDHGTAAQLYKAALYVLLGLVPGARDDVTPVGDDSGAGQGAADIDAATRNGDVPARHVRKSATYSRVRRKR
jgi:hypothetical protein